MQFPRLSPLQQRLTACIAVLLSVLVLLNFWFNFDDLIKGAYAAELDPSSGNAYAYDSRAVEFDIRSTEDEQASVTERNHGPIPYEPESAPLPRSVLGRAADGVDALTNNVMTPMDLDANSTHNFVFPLKEIASKQTTPGGLPSPFDGRRELKARSYDAPISPADGDASFEGVEGGDQFYTNTNTSLRKRQNSNSIYITATICRQPTANDTVNDSVPQLSMWLSNSKNNDKPGPNQTLDILGGMPIFFDGGYAHFEVDGSDSDINIGIASEALPPGYSGNWHFEIAASVDAPYHNVNNDTFLYLVDTDSVSAFFVTGNLTTEESNSSSATREQWMNMKPPFTMFAFNASSTGIIGLQRSFCGLQNQFNEASFQMEVGMTDRGAGKMPKEQVHIEGLKPSSNYTAFLAMQGNGTTNGLEVEGNALVGGGGRVWQQVMFTTKSDGNCQILYNLSFCSSVAYAVPANPSKLKTATDLANLYDTNAQAYYANFTKSLAQIACDTTGTAQYSLAKTCTDCANDYKDWLCSVLIPRCEDFSNRDSFLQPRLIGSAYPNGTVLESEKTAEYNATYLHRLAYNQSRNPLIDSEIQPGPYKEVLPCDDLCFGLVRSCPSALGFACPQGRQMDMSYGRKSGDLTTLTCNWPGAIKELGTSTSAASIARPVWTMAVALLMASFLV